MFGFNPSTFSDPFDVNAVAGANNRERAKLKSQSFLTDSALGGAATSIQAKNKAEDIMAKAQASARSTSNNAAMIGGALNFAGSHPEPRFSNGKSIVTWDLGDSELVVGFSDLI